VRLPRRLDWIGALVGLAFGVVDTLVLRGLGVEMQLGGRSGTPLVAGYLGVTFAVLGWAIGRLCLARARAREDAATIRGQADALDASRKEAAQNEKLAAIGRLAAGVAHEVRNPLGVIRASAAMIREGIGPETDGHRACGFILEEIDRLDGLITALLNFSRPVEPRAEQVAVGTVIDRALRLAAPSLARGGARLERAPEAPGLCAVVDPDLLSQAVLDLVTNAAEALEQRGRIVVRAGLDAGALRIDVADDGPGVAPEDVEKVFEPFYTTKATGTGLGLAMVARIAQAHRGRLALVPGAGAGPEGRGACFRLELPLPTSQIGAVAA
jgi:two-component system sensor histidine kinase HydH